MSSQSPIDLEQLLAAAIEAQHAGQFEAAEKLAREALDLDAQSVKAKLILGFLLARRGEAESAAPLLEQVLQEEPDSFEALISLSALYMEIGRAAESVSLAKRAAQVRPNDPDTLTHLGKCMLEARLYSQALEPVRAAIRINPDLSGAYLVLGQALEFLGNTDEALEAFEQAAKLSPAYPQLFALGRALLAQREYVRAGKCAAACLRLEPGSASAHLLMCGVLTELQKTEEAQAHLQRAMELDPEGNDALQIAARQRQLGMLEEANENLRRAIVRDPRRTWAYKSLMHNQRVTKKDRPLVEQMQALLKDPTLSETEAASLHYGIGKALENLGDYEQAMHHYGEANRLTRALKIGNAPFQEREYIARMNQLMNAEIAGPFCDSSLPIVVFGMMRSGTTLTEQILSSHPKIKGGGELFFWSENALRALSGDKAPFGAEYVDLLKKIGPETERVTDKMPSNYRFLGLIHSALPKARLIHVRRSPVDTCLSIWATPNHLPSEGGHNKRDIVFVYKEYLRMMEHWRSVLPEDRFFEVDYEELVANREAVTRSMVEFCGLEWDDACLSPERNMRTISTPSLWQARQPVYSSSVERWRNFEPWLGDFRELLDLQHPSRG